MGLFSFKFKKYYLYLTGLGLILTIVSIIPIRLAIASYQSPFPQAILTLGGGHEREVFAAQFAQIDPSLEIWVSSGLPSQITADIFQKAGIDEERLHIDRRAVDTVTNFTTLVEDFKNQNINHIYLITSDFHMARAKTIATIVLGSQGITFTPIAVASHLPKESNLKILRDAGRSILWLIAGRTGASFNDVRLKYLE